MSESDPTATATSTVPWRETLEGLRFECSGIQIGDPARSEAIAQPLSRELASSGTSWTLPLKKRIKVREQYTYGLRTT
jgi:hypothetical protein